MFKTYFPALSLARETIALPSTTLAKSLYVSLLLQAVTACLGLLFAVLFIALGAYKDVSGAILLLYHLICTVITVLSVRMKDT